MHGGKRKGAGRPKGEAYAVISIHLAKTHKDRLKELGIKAKEVFMRGLSEVEKEQEQC